MPWYEPAARAPPTPHRRGNHGAGGGGREEVVNVADYLDDSYDYAAAANENGGHRLSGFQHRVERQLAGIFPLADFASSHQSRETNFLSRGQSALLPPDAREPEQPLSQNDHPNNPKSEGGAVVGASKAAHFFHPRPVAALEPYKSFFSPMVPPENGEGGGGYAEAESKPAYQTNESIAIDGSDREQREVTHNTPAAPSQEPKESRPTSKLKPKDLFDSFLPTKATSDPWKRPPKQSKLVQDSHTGKVLATKDKSSREGDSRKAKTWDQYSGRGAADEEERDNQLKEKRAKAKEKKKDGTKKGKKDQQKQLKSKSGGEGDMDAFLNQGKKRPSNDSQEGADAGKKAAKKKKHKKDRSLPSTGTELEIPSYDDEGALPDAGGGGGGPRTLSEKDFDGLEQMELQNAAQCREGLEQFLRLVGRQDHVAFTLLFLDPYTGNYTTSVGTGNGGGGGKKKKRSKKGKVGSKYDFDAASRGYECTTAFLPTSKAYCTPKGPQCTAWNCTCDDQIRAMRASAALMGALFVFQNRKDSGEGDAGAWQCFLLPLGPTNESSSTQQEIEYPRMAAWPVIPFHCEVSLSDRWSAFEALLLQEKTKLVTYNATVALLPFYHHLSHDAGDSQSHCGGLSYKQFASCLAGTSSDGQSQMHRPESSNDGYLRCVWDLRLASWMLRPQATDKELEFAFIQEGFAHIIDGLNQQSPSFDMPVIIQGMVEAKNSLQFIHSVYPTLKEALVKNAMLDALECIEAPIQSLFASMEARGIGFSQDGMKSFERKLEARVEELEKKGRSITKDADFLLSSPAQVSAFLFDVLKLAVPSGPTSKTKSGQRSTSEESLKAIQAERTRAGASLPIIDIILEFRTINKLLTGFIRPLPKMSRRVKTHGGKRSKKTPSRIYPHWMQTACRTGRVSCRKPNLQQVPSGGAMGIHPRDAFVPSHGMCLFACDYSQKEVRILAHMSGDEALVSLFRGDPNVDIYKQMSSLIRNKPVQMITDVERAQFKQVTLALLYGMSPNSVAKKLSISKGQAVQMMNDFFRRFRGVKRWMDDTRQYARRKAYVKTIAGRKRYLDDINSDDSEKRATAERRAINTVIQGSAADLMKSAMINLAARLAREWPDGESRPQMLLQIHDEVILECQLNERSVKQLRRIAVSACCNDCEQYFGLKCPLLLKCSAGIKWGAMKDVTD